LPPQPRLLKVPRMTHGPGKDPRSNPSGHDHHDHGHHDHGHHDHGHHGHDHGDHHASSTRKLGAAFWLIVVVMVIEAVGGAWSNSLTLMADAGHLFVDAASLGLAWFAHRLAVRPRTDTRSFGYGRLQVLAAFVNSLLLLVIVAGIVVEAVSRMMTPHPVATGIAASIAMLGVLVNVAAAALLHGGHQHDLNTRAAYLHVLSDLVGSVAAVAAALIIRYTGWLPADAWMSLLVAALIARGAWRLLLDSAHVLQEGVPHGLDLAALATRLRNAVPGIDDVHHVHAWSLNARDTLLTAHARLRAGFDVAVTLAALKSVLVREYGIEHSTIQIELEDCADTHLHCAGEAPGARPAA
jgi:cobalt-zinc-cadmium efflux system protein